MGDMLMIPPGASDLQRVHAAYVSEDEVKAVCDYLREQGDPEYQEEILKPRDDDDFQSDSDDPLYDKAVAVVANAGYCSISHVQRQLGVGYNKAAKLVERMEQEGVVGPPSSKAGGRREVLVSPT
jgi:S-DNA-T family DNA segregation ATPase FtsK/SpoIIIE